YPVGEYDLAGFCVGVVEREDLRDGMLCEVGDVVLGLASSGLHSNGYSLARKVLLDPLELGWDARPDLLGGHSVAEALLMPTRIYVTALTALKNAGVRWHGAAHITGGGLIENPPRMWANENLAVEFYLRTWTVPKIFDLIASAGVDRAEMRRTFN